jgi:hypothetical protein
LSFGFAGLCCALLACGGEDDQATTTAGSGGDGGQGPQPCDVGSARVVEDGDCLPVGVSACAAGFQSDDKGGCRPVLPATPCADGEMALPGETACHALMDCGAAPWGTIPVDATTQYVDASYAGGGSDGTETKPWLTIEDAALAGSHGDLIAVAEGDYVESVIFFDKGFRLWGRCPQLVSVTTKAVFEDLYIAADGMEVHGIELIGKGTFGILADGALDLWIDRVHVTGDAEIGIAVFGGVEPASALIEDSLLEGTQGAGVLAIGADIELTRTCFREMQPSAMYGSARAINLEYDPMYMLPSRANVSRVLVEDASEVAIATHGSELTLTESAVLRTEPRSTDGAFGIGVATQVSFATSPPTRATVLVERSVVRDSHGFGMTNVASALTIVDSTIVGVSRQQSDDSFGDGAVVIESLASLTVETSTIRDAARAGVANFWSSAQLTGTWLDCNVFHLNAEEQNGPYVFDVAPLNACSCNGSPENCQIVSSGLKPPPPL